MQEILMRTLIGLLLVLPTIAGAGEAALLVYKVWERGSDPYISRILVTPRHVRIDEGGAGDGYTLFDRRTGVLYNVSDADRSVLVMARGGEVPEPPADLLLEARDRPDPEAPRIGGRVPHQVELLANGERCTRLETLPGVMEPALEGLRELRSALARIEAATLDGVPGALPTPCELAAVVHAPTRSLDHGLPLSERSPGRTQLLLDYLPNHAVDDGLFRVPGDYRRIGLPGGEG